MNPSVSIVVPVYNGAETVGPLVDKLIDHYGERWRLEIVLVNDGSADDSRTVCKALVAKHPSVVRFLHLSRNFGEHQAVLAGLSRTTGDAVVIMDDDFQNPPEEVAKLVSALQEGDHDVVYSRYDTKRDSLFRNLGSWFNDRAAQLMLKKPKGLYLSSFKCLNRFLVDEVCRYRGPFPYLDGLILRVTQNYGVVTCEHHARAAGQSGYTLRKLIRLWLNMFTNFSILPLRLAVFVGFVFALLGVLGAVGVVIEKLFIYPDVPIGWPSIVVAIFAFAGIQLMVLGMLGEYLGRVFLSDNGTPQFIVRDAYGFGEVVESEDSPADEAEPSEQPEDARKAG